jgi:hypothetical protein
MCPVAAGASQVLCIGKSRRPAKRQRTNKNRKQQMANYKKQQVLFLIHKGTQVYKLKGNPATYSKCRQKTNKKI